MDQSMLKYSITVDRDAWFIRFYLWLWRGDLDKITFCKLFWAYVFSAPLLVVHTTVEVVTYAYKSAGYVVGRGVVRPARRSFSYAHKTARTIIRHRLDELGKRQARERDAAAQSRQQRIAERIARETKAQGRPDARQRYLDGLEQYGTIAAWRIKAARTATVTAGRGAARMAATPIVASGRSLWPILAALGRFLWWCGVRLTNGIDRSVAGTYRAVTGTWHLAWDLVAALLRLVRRPIALVVRARATSLLLVALAGLVSLALVGTAVYFLLQWLPSAIAGFGGFVGSVLGWCGTAVATVAVTVVNSQAAFWTVVGLMLATLIGGVLMVAIMSGFAYWVLLRIEKLATASATGTGWAARRTGRAVGKGLLMGAGGGAAVGEHIGKGFRGFLRAMYLGYYGVKTSTCPRIEVKAPDD